MKDWTKVYVEGNMESMSASHFEKLRGKKSTKDVKAKHKRTVSSRQLQIEYNIREEMSLASL